VYLACRALWETSDKPFYPKIKTIREVCEAVYSAINGLLPEIQASGLLKAPVKQPKRVREEDSESGKIRRRKLCDFLILKSRPDYFELDKIYSNYHLEGVAKHLGFDINAEEEPNYAYCVPHTENKPFGEDGENIVSTAV
jgi:hypothetical protein